MDGRNRSRRQERSCLFDVPRVSVDCSVDLTFFDRDIGSWVLFFLPGRIRVQSEIETTRNAGQPMALISRVTRYQPNQS